MRFSVPGDKSISHRMLILGALAEGTSRVGRILQSADVKSTAAVLRALGVEISELGETTSVRGVGLRGLRAAVAALDCGNSGTTARLMSGVLAAHPFASSLVGDASLSRRPMRRVARPLSVMGARFNFGDADEVLPMTIHGGDLTAIDWTNEPPSAQVKSAILLAALVAGVRATVREAVATRDHTERLLRSLGVDVRTENGVVAIEPTEAMQAFTFDVPADPSSAAFLAGAGVLGIARHEVAIDGVLLNPTRIGFYDVLRRMGADVQLESDANGGAEPVGTIRTHRASLTAVSVGAAEVPSMVDELPLLACIATRAQGETVIRGASELRVKESDRIRAVVSNLRALGADAEELEDGMIVRGGSQPLCGDVRTESDHRIAMAFGVLGALPGNDIRVDDPHCVDISYPGFWSDLAHVAG